jgi:hypothetical protein
MRAFVSASSSLRAASSAASVDALSSRTRSPTAVDVTSAISRSRSNEGDVTPRSQRETVIDATPSASASCFCVSSAPSRAARTREPSPPLSTTSKSVALVPQPYAPATHVEEIPRDSRGINRRPARRRLRTRRAWRTESSRVRAGCSPEPSAASETAIGATAARRRTLDDGRVIVLGQVDQPSPRATRPPPAIP